MKNCPVEVAMRHIGRKWTIHIIRDMLRGYKRFTDFLRTNKNLSTKVLSQRLKDMEFDGLIEKRVVSTTPIVIEYELTEKGHGLCDVITALSEFSIRHYSEEVFHEVPESFDATIEEAQARFTPGAA